MDFGGRIKRRKPSRDRRVSHPLSIGARMMVRVSERAFDNVNLGGIAEVQRLLSHVGGMKVFFFFPALFRQAKTYKVAVIKQLDHASLDEIANAVTAELDKIAADNGVTIEYEITSGQGDQTILKQLADQAIADGVDAIVPIATTAAQIAALSAEDAKTMSPARATRSTPSSSWI